MKLGNEEMESPTNKRRIGKEFTYRSINSINSLIYEKNCGNDFVPKESQDA